MPVTKTTDRDEPKTPARKRRGFPVLPTLMVLLSVPVLIGFGTWQMQRLKWKETVLTDMAAAADLPPLPLGSAPIPDKAAFRQVTLALTCPSQKPRAEAGRNLRDSKGWAFVIDCTHESGETVQQVVGFAQRPEALASVAATSGTVTGLMAPGTHSKWRLTSAEAMAPLEPAAPPSSQEIPNNHLSYAMQWFSFAVILVVIYGLWLRRWLATNRSNA